MHQPEHSDAATACLVWPRGAKHELIDQRRAEALAVHALAIGGVMAALLTLLPAILAWPTFRLPGGREEGLAPSVADARVQFGGAIAIWLTSMFAPIVRGIGVGRWGALAPTSVAPAHHLRHRAARARMPLLSLTRASGPGVGGRVDGHANLHTQRQFSRYRARQRRRGSSRARTRSRRL